MFVPLVLAVGGGGGGDGGSSGGGSGGPGSSSEYRFNLTVGYNCQQEELAIMVKNIDEPNGKLNEFSIKAYKDTIIVKSGKTNIDGSVNFSIKDEGTYLINGKKDKYFEQRTVIEVKECEGNEPEFFCEQGETMKERIKCVLNLPDEYVNEVRYVPEECKVIKDEGQKSECIQSYKVQQTCRDGFETDAEREECIKPKLGLSEDLQENIDVCKAKIGLNNQQLCFQDLKENVLKLVKFRMYNLVYKVYELWEVKGLGLNETADFIALIYEKKLEFNDAKTISEKKEVVKSLKNEWEKFKEEIKQQIEAS